MNTHQRYASLPEKLADGLWLLGNSYFNLYLARGDKASAFMEMGVSAMADEVADQLGKMGVTPDYLIVMHPHGDHLNGLPILREYFPSARVIAGEGAPEFLVHPKTAAGLISDDRYFSEFLARKGLGSTRPPLREAPSLEGAVIVQDNEELDLGGLTLKFLDVEGHALGNLAVYIPEIRTLMPSDSLGFRIPALGFFPIFFTGYDAYMATLDRLEALDPEILGLPHQGPLFGEEIREAFMTARQNAKSLWETIRNDLRSEEEIIAEIYRDYYRDELTLYTPENIITCCKLLIRRSRA
ncbi:MAG: MBL fold metallo-hydrolase [Deltaproteobacteria bacterium]|nr:MBL fold metallo-hydrolase [Deltaproteobacteria bacterium]